MKEKIYNFVNNKTLQIYFRLFIILLAFFTNNLLTEIIAWLIVITASLNICYLTKKRDAYHKFDNGQIATSIIIIVFSIMNILLNFTYL